MYIPMGAVFQRELVTQFERAKARMGPEVVHVTYRLREDHAGDPGIFFRITLADEAAKERVISDVAGRVENILLDEIHPLENWGLIPYFNYRSYSDQQEHPSPNWV